MELIVAGGRLNSSAALIDEVLKVAGDGSTAQRDFVLSATEDLADADEIGIGHARNPDSPLVEYWAINIARREVASRYITGVVYEDTNANGRFDGGEGIGGMVVTSGPLIATSDESGWYSLPISGGDHRIIADGDAFDGPLVQDVRVKNDNVQVDFQINAAAAVNFRPRLLWTAPVQHLDVNQNGQVNAQDALLVINRLDRLSGTRLPAVPGPNTPLVDCNGDGTVTALDALLVINGLSRLF